MDPLITTILAHEGGCADRSTLLRHVSWHRLRASVREGQVARVRRDRYALPGLAAAEAGALAVGGVVSHRSAALRHRLPILSEPRRPEITVPRSRRVGRARGLDLRYRDLHPADIQDDLVTSAVRTVVDCARDLPLPEALAVADSALRTGLVSAPELVEAIPSLPRTGRRAAEAVLRHASGEAANPFESALRAIALGSVGALFVPQLEVVTREGVTLHPDLGCEELRIALEADSFAFHGGRKALAADCWRYNELAVAGWLVLRFAWEHVMHQGGWVASVIEWAVALRRGHPPPVALVRDTHPAA